LANSIHGLIPVTGKAMKAGGDWRDDPDAVDPRQRAVHANVARGHAATLLLDKSVIQAFDRLGKAALPLYMTEKSAYDNDSRAEFYAAVDETLTAIAERVRQLYGYES
jgi:hypothetical protein